MCIRDRHLIVLGAEEGKLPGYSGSAGVLTDQERVALRELGVPLTGGAMEGVQAEFAEIYGCFCGAMAVSYTHLAQILNQLWEILLGALEQMYDVLGDTHWEGEQFTRLFRLLLSQYDVGTRCV